MRISGTRVTLSSVVTATGPLDVSCGATLSLSALKIAGVAEPPRLLGLEVPRGFRTAAPAADVLRCLTDQGKTSGQGNSPVAFCGTIR